LGYEPPFHALKALRNLIRVEEGAHGQEKVSRGLWELQGRGGLLVKGMYYTSKLLHKDLCSASVITLLSQITSQFGLSWFGHVLEKRKKKAEK